MMKVLVQNEIVKVEFDEAKSLFKHTWNDKTSDLDDELYKSLVLMVNQEMEKIQEIHFHLIDTSQFLFIILPQVQEWVSEYCFSDISFQKSKKDGIFNISGFICPNIHRTVCRRKYHS